MKTQLICLFFISTFFLRSQNPAQNWYFGTMAGISFSTVPPSILTNGALTTSEGCSSISDAGGNLLFYTDGITVWNQTHVVMANGNGLFGNGSSTQAGVIVKQPGSSTIYYIFTIDDVAGPDGLRYSTVDMTLAAGLGSVTVKNTPLYTPSTEKITGVKHCNGTDIWVVSHDYNSNNFRTFLVTSAGVNTTPVISAVGTNHTGGSSLTVGALKTSPNGRKLGICMSNVINNIELYDFDNATGIVSNPLVLATITGIYGCEFSPDGTKFYGSPWAGTKIYQWDLCAGSGTAIIASEYTVSASNCGQMQLGPDGKIYMARSGQTSLGVVNNPNGLGSACNYVNTGQSIAPKTSSWGLPNFITSGLDLFTYTQACATVSFAPSLAAIGGGGGGCSAATSTFMSVGWNFGDPSSGAQNTSTLTNPTHHFGTAGTYTVKLIRISNCGTDTISLPITVINPPLSFNSVPTVTQANCTSTVNGFNLGLSFMPASPAPNYTVTWNAIPAGVLSPTQIAGGPGLAPGVYIATISVDGGCSTISSFSIAPPTTMLNFSVTPLSILNCFQPSVTINLDPINTYTWTSLSQVLTGSSATFTYNSQGTWTVTGANSSGCIGTSTFAINQNIAVPSSVISPSFQTINCNITSINVFTATANPSVNVSHQVLSPQGGTFSSASYSISYLPGGVGTFTHCLINDVNGCSTCKTFTVFSNDGFPTFNVSSPQNFTLGCSSKSTAVINITNGNTSPPGGPVSYTLLSPSSPSATPPGTLNGINTYTVAVPGSYTVITKDNTSFCETRVPISVLQNTLTPDIHATLPIQVLDCNTPQIIMEGYSSTPNISYNWGFPPIGGAGNVAGYSITVISNSIQPTATLVANYTLTITDNNNTCMSTSLVPVYQNIFPPKAIITDGGVSSLSCKISTITLTNLSQTGIPPSTFPANKPVIAYIWDGPTPQQQGQVNTTYLAGTPGIYTMTAMDLNNGCMSTNTIVILDNRVYPDLNKPVAPPNPTLDCGAPFTKVFPSINGSSSPLTFSWTAPPSASVNGVTTPTLSTNMIGDYEVFVTNTVSGCSSRAYIIVYSGTLNADFSASDTTGFSPLEISFTNLSNSSLNNLGINSTWSFGNGTSTITSSADIPVSTSFRSAGNYTVMLYAVKGACMDTASKVIHVDLASALEVPNIFTPNGDGTNDFFYLKTANLAEIICTITDRWGRTVYETTSYSGNILWDGMLRSGNEAAEGVYLYIITATGTDGETYKKHGNITLVR